MADTAEFAAGEVVLAFHGPLLYEGKVQAVQMRTDPAGNEVMMYYNHYKGWNRSWDEWLPKERIRKMNAVNLELQKSLFERAAKKPGKRSQSGSGDKPSESISKKRRGEQTGNGDGESASSLVSDIKIVLPDELKLVLVEDWHYVVVKKMVSVLKQPPTITEVLTAYCDQVHGTKARAVALEVCSGLKLYFEHGCGPLLLYKQERPQYDELIAEDEDVRICNFYGVVHLLRLFVKLPSMMQSAGVGPKGMVYLMKCFQDILHFLKTKHIPQSMDKYYQECSASYIEKVKKV